jgi:hypothetical protein
MTAVLGEGEDGRVGQECTSVELDLYSVGRGVL